MSGDDLPGQAQPGGDEAVFPVPVGSLVEIHKVHVDLFVGDLPVVLGSKMAVGLLELGQAAEPHLAGGKGVAPGDDAQTAAVIICLPDHAGDLPAALYHGLARQGPGQGPAEFLRHLPGAALHGLQHLRAVEGLASHHEPKFTGSFIHKQTPF